MGLADHGQGIRAQDAERIFVPLKRLHGPEIPRTGLGLALCKRIVIREGGDIWVASVPGEGSTFYLTLPVQS